MSRKSLRAAKKANNKSSTAKKSARCIEATCDDAVETSREDVPEPIPEETVEEVGGSNGCPAAVKANVRMPSSEFESLRLSKITSDDELVLTLENTNAIDSVVVSKPFELSPPDVDCRAYGSKQVAIAGGSVDNRCEEKAEAPSGVTYQARADQDIDNVKGLENHGIYTANSEIIHYRKAFSDILTSNENASSQAKEIYRTKSLCSFDGLGTVKPLAPSNGVSDGRIRQLPGTPPPNIEETRHAERLIKDAKTKTFQEESISPDLLRKRDEENTEGEEISPEQGKLETQQESSRRVGLSTMPPEQGTPLSWSFRGSEKRRGEMERAAAYKNQRKPNIRKRMVKDGIAIQSSPQSKTPDVSLALESDASARVPVAASDEHIAIGCSAPETGMRRDSAGLQQDDTGSRGGIIEAIQSTIVSMRELKAEALPGKIESGQRGGKDCNQQQNIRASRSQAITARSDGGDQENSHLQGAASAIRTETDSLSLTSREKEARLAGQTPRDAATHRKVGFISKQQWRRLKKTSRVDESEKRRGSSNECEYQPGSTYSGNDIELYPSELQPPTFIINRNHQPYLDSLHTQIDPASPCQPAHTHQRRDGMGAPGSAHASRGSSRGNSCSRTVTSRSSEVNATADFIAKATPPLSRNTRGFQPSEVNRSKTKQDLDVTNVHDSTRKTPENFASASTTLSRTSNLTSSADQARASGTKDVTASAWHHTVDMPKDGNPKLDAPPPQTQSGSMERELEPVSNHHSDTASEASSSSVEIITHKSEKSEKQPSCWSRAAPTEPQKRPTWDDSFQEIDRLDRDRPPVNTSQEMSQRPNINNIHRHQSLSSHGKLGQTASNYLSRQLSKSGIYNDKRAMRKGSAESKGVSPSDVTPLRASQAHRPQQSVEELALANRRLLANPSHTARSPNLHNSPKDDSNVNTTGSPHLRNPRIHSGLAEEKKKKSALLSPHHENASNEPANTRPLTKEDNGKDFQTIELINSYNAPPPHLQGPTAHDDTVPEKTKSVATFPGPQSQSTKGVVDKEHKKPHDSSQPEGFVKRNFSHDKAKNGDHEQAKKVPPHLRTKPVKADSTVPITKGNTESNAEESLLSVKTSMAPDCVDRLTTGDCVTELQDSPASRASTKADVSPNEKGRGVEGNEGKVDKPKHRSSAKKGKKSEWEANDYEPGLADWDGSWQPAPVGDEWTIRDPFDVTHKERSSVIQAWKSEVAESASIPVEVDTEDPEFRTGAGVLNGDVDLQRAIEASITVPNYDEYTLAKRNQTAQDAIEEREALALRLGTVKESKSKNVMSKEERREYRRQLIEDQRNYVPPPNPHAPDANIYMRPAEVKDLRQITEIYNYYSRTSAFTPFTDELQQSYWHDRLQDIQAESLPFVVAILMADKASQNFKDVRRLKQERVVGFANAVDFGSRSNAFRYTVELDIWVDPGHLKKGIGKTLLDRMIAVMCPQYSCKDPAPFLCEGDYYNWMGGGKRAIKTILFSMLYSAKEEEEVKWKKQWLEKWNFTQGGVIEKIGYKFGRPIKQCQYYYTTWADIPTR